MSAVLELPKKQNEISVIAEKIDTGLQAFEERKAELSVLKEQAIGLKITSIDDKVTISQVSMIRKKLKSSRVEIEKEGKSMRDPLTRISKLISEKEKELVAIIEPTEKELLRQEQWVDDEKERIRLEAEAIETARVQDRINKLSAFGYAIDYDTVKNYDDASFEHAVETAKAEYETLLAAKAEELRLAREEAARLKAEREELERLRAEQAKAQAIIEENNQRIKREQEAKEAAIRVEHEKIEAEKRAAERERQRIEQEKKRQDELEQARKDAAEKSRLKAIEDARIEAEKKELELLEQKAKELREAALRPDKEKLQAFAERIGGIVDFQVKDEKAQHILADVQIMISKMQKHILSKIKEL